ncbi:hypothetical protein ACOSP7_029498 [Xanthoceras sorbifolium]
MTSPIPYPIDDKDLDDAALWAVIDSAAASHSSSSISRKPLAIKYPNYQSPPTPVSHPSPPPPNFNRLHHYHRQHKQYSPNSVSHGEIINEDTRPKKMARKCSSEMSESSPLVVVQRNSPSAATYCSPEAYLSPGISGRNEEQDIMKHSLSGRFPSVSLFKEYQNAAMAILEKSDYTMISGSPFIKKSGWRKISFYFNVSFEIKDKTIEFDENRNVQRAEFVVRAYMQGGRFSDGWGSCERREKRFSKPNHDIPSTAETRAKNKACQDLLGIGEYRPGVSQCQR